MLGLGLIWLCLCASQCEKRNKPDQPATVKSSPAGTAETTPTAKPVAVPPQSEAPPQGQIDREVKQGAAPNQGEIDAEKAKTDKKHPKTPVVKGGG